MVEVEVLQSTSDGGAGNYSLLFLLLKVTAGGETPGENQAGGNVQVLAVVELLQRFRHFLLAVQALAGGAWSNKFNNRFSCRQDAGGGGGCPIWFSSPRRWNNCGWRWQAEVHPAGKQVKVPSAGTANTGGGGGGNRSPGGTGGASGANGGSGIVIIRYKYQN